MTRRPLAILLLALGIAISCTREPQDPADFEPSIPAGNATEAPLLPRFADQLPDSDPDGFGRLLQQLRGTPVLVNFWGSWCPPCKDEMPRIVAAHRAFGDRVQFLGIDIEDSREEARRFVERFGMRFPSVFDPADAIKTSLGRLGQPLTLFYRDDGSFFTAWAGPISEDTLLRNLRAIAS